jgi:hypothetical protein
MNEVSNKSVLESLIVQLIGLAVLSLGFIIGMLIQNIGYIASAVIYILVLILFFYLKKNNYKVHSVSIITSFATGLLIGSFISRYSKDFLILFIVIGIFALIITVVHGLLLLSKHRLLIIGITIALFIIVIIIGFIVFKQVIIKELTLLGVNFLFTLIGMYIYFNTGKDLDLYLAGSLLWAFIAIFIIILIILSEGEAISGVDIHPGGNRKKKKKEAKGLE